ncbi:MAG TPA: FkbM family methyltransferase [Thermoleophilaceae bacterium]|nr:FkbM family methyltransferase [Thermoleophilaceae bacterium]
MRAFADCHPHAFFVEIGSNDGEQHDHLRPFILTRGWRGIMVEPVPYVFARLRRNYAGVPGVILENVAVADRDGQVPFYYLADASEEERLTLPDWYDGIGSLDRDFLVGHEGKIADIESRIVCEPVTALTFDSLCEKHGVTAVDLIVIDTEGYDWEILRRFDFERWHPELLVYEHFHLSPADRADAAARLREAGYDTMEEGFDTFCLHGSADPILRELWRRLRPAVPGSSVHEE